MGWTKCIISILCISLDTETPEAIAALPRVLEFTTGKTARNHAGGGFFYIREYAPPLRALIDRSEARNLIEARDFSPVDFRALNRD